MCLLFLPLLSRDIAFLMHRRCNSWRSQFMAKPIHAKQFILPLPQGEVADKVWRRGSTLSLFCFDKIFMWINPSVLTDSTTCPSPFVCFADIFPPETGTLLSASQTFPLTGEFPHTVGESSPFRGAEAYNASKYIANTQRRTLFSVRRFRFLINQYSYSGRGIQV